MLSDGSLDWFKRAVLESLRSEPRIAVVAAVVDSQTPQQLPTRLRRELSRGRGGYVAVMSASAAWRRLHDPPEPASEWFSRRGIPVLPASDLYCGPTLEFISHQQPDVLFRNGFGIIREPVLSLAPRGVLSYHHGDIRRYRGTPYGFWELVNAESSIGITVQILSAELDAGRIVLEQSLPIRPTDSWRGLRRRALRASVDMARDACVRLMDPGFQPHDVRPEELGPVYTLPNLRTWLGLQGALTRRRLTAMLSRVVAPARPHER